jgi:hypothetical protein
MCELPCVQALHKKAGLWSKALQHLVVCTRDWYVSRSSRHGSHKPAVGRAGLGACTESQVR